MLTICPECTQNVSDKAISCPHCGYPINLPLAEQKPNKGQIRKHKRMPNGSGSIKKLSGNRQKPFAAFAPTTGYKENGTAIRPLIGYYASRIEAENALVAYRSGRAYSSRDTFADIYKGFYEEKFVKSKKPISKSSIDGYESAFKQCAVLHNEVFEDLRKADLQAIFDSSTLSYSSLSKIKLLMGQMYKYAMSHDIVPKDWSEFVIIPKADDSEHGVPFTAREITKLRNHDDDERAQIALLLIYTGMRIGELFTAEYDASLDAFIGGLKTEAGKNRTIPVHPSVKPYIGAIDKYRGTALDSFRKTKFYPLMKELKMEYAASGEKHTPHDCRHTFSWLADKYNVDELSKHLIMGHSLGKDVEKAVYGHRTLEELRTEICKIN